MVQATVQRFGGPSVPSTRPVDTVLQGIAQERRADKKAEEERERQAGVLAQTQELAGRATDRENPKRQQAFADLAVLNKDAAAAIDDINSRADAQELVEAKENLNRDARAARLALDAPDIAARQDVVRRLAKTDPDFAEVAGIVDPDDQLLALQRMALTNEAGANALFKPGDFSKTLVEGVDAEGKPVFAQARATGGVEIVPGLTPAGPTAKELADTEKAQTAAAAAEQKLTGEQRQVAQAQETRSEIAALAKDLAGRENLGDVFGAIQGLIPTVTGASVDLEADLDRLDSLLTLGNTEKMVGVLSESDIKILQQAGSVLSNRRISDSRAKQELERINEVFARNPGAEQALSDAAAGQPAAGGELTLEQLKAERARRQGG